MIMSYDLTALYEKLSHDDELQGKSNNIINQGDIFQGGFLPKDEIPHKQEVAYFYSLSILDKSGISDIFPPFLHCSLRKVIVRLSVHFQEGVQPDCLCLFSGISQILSQYALQPIRVHCLFLLHRPDSRNALASSALWSKSIPPTWHGSSFVMSL